MLGAEQHLQSFPLAARAYLPSASCACNHLIRRSARHAPAHVCMCFLMCVCRPKLAAAQCSRCLDRLLCRGAAGWFVPYPFDTIKSITQVGHRRPPQAPVCRRAQAADGGSAGPHRPARQIAHCPRTAGEINDWKRLLLRRRRRSLRHAQSAPACPVSPASR